MEKITLSRKSFLPFLLLLFIPVIGLAQTTYSADGSYVVPAGVTQITVEAYGGGGKGGSRGTNGVSGGGGGGAYCRKVYNVTPGDTFSWTIGLGATSNVPGGNTVVQLNTVTSLTAGGGNSPNLNLAPGSTGGTATGGDVNYAGGNGGTASTGNYSGGGGSSGGTGSAGGNGFQYTGGTATGAGSGGNGRLSANTGIAGTVPGGGGGGAFRQGGSGTLSGGNGANGRVIITPHVPEINVTGNGVSIVDGDNTPNATDDTDFGATDITTGTVTQTYTIQNLGLLALNIGGVTITGLGAADFSIVTPPAATVAAGGSTTLVVMFNPSITGTRTATVTITNDDSDEAVYTFLIEGTGTNPEINVTGNAANIADGDTTPTTADHTDFGSTYITGGTITRTFTIQHDSSGSGTLSIGTITISGANASDFSVTTLPGSTSLASSASTTFVVTFNPSATGLRTATISIASNDANENPYDFTIQGTGTDPEINVTGNGTNISDGATTTSTITDTDFGIVTVTSGNAVKTFTIQNAAGATSNLIISSISISGANAADFSYTAPGSSNLAPGASTTFTVTFDPTVQGTRNATVNINTNDSDETPYDFAVSGVGSDTEIDIQGNATSIADGDITPSTSDNTNFGSAEITLGSVVNTFTIYNTGTSSLTLTSATIGGTSASSFSFAGLTFPTTVVPGSSVTFTITFNPSTTGTKNATISIANNDTNENPYDFSIQGTGTSPEMNVVGNLISIVSNDMSASVSDNTDFGTVSVDAGSTLVTYTIQNTGTGNLNIGSVYFTGTNASDYSVQTAPASSVASGSSTTFTVSFNPTVIGPKVAYLYINNDDANENPYHFQITGLGVRTYPDTDGDNVSDNFDKDDDNDGIIDETEQSECILSPVSGSVTYTFLNETFGAGTTKGLININIPGATCTYCYEDGVVGPNTTECPSQSSWILDDGEYVVVYKIAGTVSTDPENIHGDLAWNGLEDHTTGDTNGRMAVFNASFTPGTFYETTIMGIMPNVPVTYSFYVLNIMSVGNYVGSILPNITVEFIDPATSTVLSTYNTGDIGRCDGGTGVNTCAYSEWQQYTTTVNLGTVTTFTIRFKNNAPGGGGNDLAIDDITLKQQYCDRDLDGIADLFDLDSDNDGIPDVEEAGFKALSSGKATIDRTLAWTDADINGVMDSIDATITAATYLIPDNDGDGVKDFHDLDSDNDAQFDVDESNLYNGDGDINGDGFGDGVDTDDDGVLDLFDSSISFGTNTRPYADDTDTDGISNYNEMDANTDGVKDILTTLYGSYDANLDGAIDGSADADKDGILDTFDTKTTGYGSPRDLNRKLFLDFDGRNDYGQGPQFTSGLAKSTIMCWIKLTAPFTSTGYVIGQDNFSLRVDMSSGSPKVIVTAVGGVFTTSVSTLSPSRWYHICAVYDGTSATDRLKLYINGRLEITENSGTLAGTLATSTGKFTFGRNPNSAANYFKGSIDEVRVFNTALTTDQIQKMVYQEIKQQGTAIRGEIVPKNIESSLWFNLMGYYRMDAYKDDVIDNYFTAGIDTNASSTKANIYNHKVISYQLAPMPFVTTLSTSLENAVSQNNFVNGNDLFDYDWSILQIKHNINLPFNLTGVGLFIDPSITVNLNNDNKIQNTWYMRLNGKLDLQGRSQLVQTSNSDLDPLSSGYIERDQQGQTNKWNYNYWAMPVGAISATTNNNAQTVASLMKDGTDAANPQTLQWTTGVNSSPTSPITLSSYWIFKFQNVSNAYANWSTVGPNGTLTAGQGFTLKGSNALTPTQNYTFVGKPNNAVSTTPITLPIAANNLNLCGNPFPSAIDANQFITDNLTSLNGTLYFWEHFSTNTTHVLSDYQGGYATRTLVGGTPPVSPSEVSGLGSSTKVPGRFIPVGQGFFVTANATGGTITFNNGQRAFVKEDDATSNTLFRQAHHSHGNNQQNVHNNHDDQFEQDTFGKIRVGYNSNNNYHRQVLIGFMDQYATPAFNPGYDAKHIDSQPNDMYFVLGYDKLNIQGDGYFNSAGIYPIGVKNATAGSVSFTLDGTENFDEDQPIYIYDNVTGLYHNIRDGKFEISLPAGTNDTRFSLRFTAGGSTAKGTETADNSIFVAYASANSTINIKNNVVDTTVKSVELYSIIGQSVSSWEIVAQDQKHIQLPVKNLATGTYIVKMKTNKGDVSKKVIIK
jgi:trimeric autotransporter adhesin